MRLLTTLVVVSIVVFACGCGKKQLTADDLKCDTMLDSKTRSVCFYNKSVMLRNPTTCKDITNREWRAKCIDDVSVMLLQETYCYQHDKLSLREACDRKVAQAKKNATGI